MYISCNFGAMSLRLRYNSLFLGMWLALCLRLLAGLWQPTKALAATTRGTQPLLPDSSLSGLDSSFVDAVAGPTVSADTMADTISAPTLTKPKPLKSIQAASSDPLSSLDQLVAKQPNLMTPYIPLLQELVIGLDYSRLAMNILRRSEHRYEGSLGMLWRGNIQLFADLGHNLLHPSHTSDNKSKYKVEGLYGRIGVDYLARYSARDNLYAGLRYGRSHFTNCTKPDNPRAKSISQALTASWFEVVVGSDTRLFEQLGLYAGLAFRLGILYDFQEFQPANNYVIPGYGRTTNKLSPSLNLYIQYRLSFLNRQISFN